MATISSIGVGSGLDVESIVTKLVALEKTSLTTLQSQASLITSKISTVTQLKSLVSTLQDKLKVLADASSWSNAMKASTSNATALSASVNTSSTSANAQAGSYNVTVDKLATAQSVTSGRFTSGNTFTAGGTLTIASTGSSSTPIQPITISAGSTLAQVANSINQANTGVTASILNDGTGQRLVITSTASGSNNGFTLTGTDDLTSLNYGGSTDSAILDSKSGEPNSSGSFVSAQNAEATINGIQVSSASNIFSDTIQGVNFTAQALGSSTLSIGSDTDSLKTRINDFVTAYNAVNTLLSTSVKYDDASKVAGVFQADSTMVSLQNAMRNAFAGSATTSTVFSRLSDLGIDMQKGGALKVDDTKLGNALKNNSSEVAKFFSQGSEGIADKLQAYTAAVLSFDGILENKASALSSSQKQNTKNQDKVNTHADLVEARLRAQYSALDTKMSSLTALSTYVTQQVAQWNKSTS